MSGVLLCAPTTKTESRIWRKIWVLNFYVVFFLYGFFIEEVFWFFEGAFGFLFLVLQNDPEKILIIFLGVLLSSFFLFIILEFFSKLMWWRKFFSSSPLSSPLSSLPTGGEKGGGVGLWMEQVANDPRRHHPTTQLKRNERKGLLMGRRERRQKKRGKGPEEAPSDIFAWRK